MSKKEKQTTIAVDREVREALRKLGKGNPPNQVIRNLLRGITDVYVEFVLIDNELPVSHTAVFQMGEDSKSLYFWNGETLAPITVEEVQARLKQPKPNMTITREDAKIIYKYLPGRQLPNLPMPEKEIQAIKRFEQCLEKKE